MFLDRASWLHRLMPLKHTKVGSCVSVLCVHLFVQSCVLFDGDLSMEFNCVVMKPGGVVVFPRTRHGRSKSP